MVSIRGVRSIYLQGILLAESSKWPRFAQESGLADRVISCLEQLVVQLGRRDRVDLCLGYARGLCWVTHIVLGAETIQQVAYSHRAQFIRIILIQPGH